MSGVAIIPATPADLPRLAEIELAAARLFSREDVPAAMADESMPIEELERARAAGRLWVARLDGRPVGFLVGGTKDGLPYVAEVDVHPDLHRRGIGTALLRAAIDWARLQRAAWLTLTTFRHVPFNAPFYAKLGFAEIPAAELGPELRAKLESEARCGMDPAKRVAMRLPLHGA